VTAALSYSHRSLILDLEGFHYCELVLRKPLTVLTLLEKSDEAFA